MLDMSIKYKMNVISLVAFNNHFAVCGPQSANDFLKLMSRQEINFKNELKQQHTLNLSTVDLK